MQVSSEKTQQSFYRAVVSEGKNRELPAEIVAPLRTLSASRRPVIVCGTDVTRLTTPAFAADCARLLRLTGKEAGLFYLLPGAGSFSAALLSGGDGRDRGSDSGAGFSRTLSTISKKAWSGRS